MFNIGLLRALIRLLQDMIVVVGAYRGDRGVWRTAGMDDIGKGIEI
jgi:hypothetical protein